MTRCPTPGRTERGLAVAQNVPAPPGVAFLLGKPPRPDSVIADALGHLRARAIPTAVWVPDGKTPLPEWLADVALVVQRGLAPRDILAAVGLEQRGVRCCNRISATIAVRNRFETARRLDAAGVGVPATTAAHTWDDVIETARGSPVVVKATEEATGRGRTVFVAATGSLPDQAPFAGPYMVQEFVAADDRVHKVYVVGIRTYGLLKHGPIRTSSDGNAVAFVVDEALAAVARGVGSALHLEIFGADVLLGQNGPTVVDVNPFPGFRGVPPAAAEIARFVAEIFAVERLARR